MSTNLSSEDVVVCISSPQMISTEGGVAGGVAQRVAASSAAVELGRRLLLAARAGDTDRVLGLMGKGAPFTTDWLGTSPLHLAASNNHVATCAVLLRAGVSRDCRSKVERTPLHLAAYAGHADVAALLVDHGAQLDTRDMLRMTPLHWAAQRGHTRCAAALLAAGCALAPLSKFNKTPRDLAAAAGHSDVVALLDTAATERQKDADRGRRWGVPPESPALAPAPASAPRRPPTPRRARAPALAHLHIDSTQTTQGFTPIHRIQEIKPNAKTKVQQENTSKTEEKTEANNSSSSNTGGDDSSAAAALLRRHGITLLPADRGSTVLSALQAGRTVVLSDAGKLMLKESTAAPATSTPLSTTPAPTAAAKGLKLITLNNKLVLPQKHKTNIANVQLSPVKLLQLGDKLCPASSKPRKLRRGGSGSGGGGTPVKIIVNSSNCKLLSAANLKQNALSQLPPSESPAQEDSASLRAQLQAARKAIAALTAELACCKAKLHQLQRQHT